MSLWRQLSRGLFTLFRRSDADQELDDELRHYLEQSAAAHSARGLTREAAGRAARMELGYETQVREQVRGYGWENLVSTAWADLRYAARKLRHEPGFSAVTILVLALSIGGATAIFSAVNPVLFESLPYPDPGRIVTIWETGRDGGRSSGSFGMYHELAARARSFDAIAVLRGWQPTIVGGDQPERLEGERVSAGWFRVLGIPPVIGRGFDPSDDAANGPNVVVLSDRLWRRRFNADSAIVGRQISLDENSFQVVGVMPASFDNVLTPAAELWAPLQYDLSQGRAWGHHLRTIGRLGSGVTADQARAELDRVGQAAVDELDPVTYGPEIRFLVTGLQQDVTRGVRPALLAMLGAVTLLLVIGCVNVTGLLLARHARRRAEFALRSALGAGRGRLVRQLLAESGLVGLLGGVVGLLVAHLGVGTLLALSPAGLPRAGAIQVDGTVFGFTLGLTLLVGLVIGIGPALRVARESPRSELQQGSSRVSGGRHRTRSILVVAEVALALVLLVSSGLLLRSLNRLFAIEPGFDPASRLTLQVQTSGRRFAADSTTYRFFVEALEAVRRVPGVEAAALTSQLPLSGDLDLYGVYIDPAPMNDPGDENGSYRYSVSPGYIEAMGIPLKQGRTLEEQDLAGSPRVALISESLARRRLPGVDPIGYRLKIGDGPLYTVVGVVGDVKQQSLNLAHSEAVYVSATQWRFADNVMSLVVHTRSDPASLAAAVRAAVWSVDPNQPVVRVATLSRLVAASAAERRFALIVFEAFALLALLLAAAGIYGVLAGSVAERTREIGVRAALGASRGSILGLVMRQGLTLAALGVLIGVPVAIAATRALVSLLFGVSRLDPVTYLGVVGLLGGVALIACGVPAWRALRVDPVSTLRGE